MTAVTQVKKHINGLTSEVPIYIDQITITSDYTYTISVPTGKALKVLSCYNNTDGASVVVTQSSGVLTLGNGQSLSGEDTMIMYTFVDA